MERVGVRELRNQVAAVLRRARGGERVIITVDGRAVAQLGPVEPDHHGVRFDDLVAAGLVTPPGRLDHPSLPAATPVAVDVDIDRVLDEIRSSRR